MTLTKSLKALSDEKRLCILQLLINTDLCVGALAQHLDISKPAVSQHLRVLRKAGLVRGEKRGYWTHYMVDKSVLVQVAKELNELATKGNTSGTLCRRMNEPSAKTHQSKEVDMCRNCCQQPIKLKDKPENCSPEQIRDCHGAASEHPCAREENGAEK